MHLGEAISPPDEFEYEQYYMHNNQIDHNLVITGERKFILINPAWDELTLSDLSKKIYGST